MSTQNRTEKKSIHGALKHGMTSIERFFKHNVSNNTVKQECINLIIGKSVYSTSQAHRDMDERLLKYRSEFTVPKSLTLQIITWNLGGRSCQEVSSIADVLEFHGCKG